MGHMLDKDTVNRILHLHRVQGLEPKIIAERFGFDSARVHNIIRRKLQAASTKPQASSAIQGTHSKGRILNVKERS